MSNATTAMMSLGDSASAVARADSLAASIFAPCIEPERSITTHTAMSGCSRVFSASKRTGMICSILVAW